MIINTLLILGAGSSVECGFPVGETLIRDIYEFAKGKTQGFQSRDGSIKEIYLDNIKSSQRRGFVFEKI